MLSLNYDNDVILCIWVLLQFSCIAYHYCNCKI